MAENIDDSIRKTSINLSRNKPVALVVAVAGFLGSHLVDKLLDKEIQVVGVDDLGSGEKQNLLTATQNRNFHLVIESPDKIDLDLPRLDYIFILTPQKWNLDSVLELFKKFKSRCLLVSSIDLYERGNDSDQLKQLKNAEAKLAGFAARFNLNARILRLGPIYGPRMGFTVKDPLIKLIQQALTSNLQKDVTLEFSSRALYFADAVDLIIRTIFAGSTSQKIFDGVDISPIKVSEIKQVLLDPVWYESRDFIPSPLPPWPTPNLDKTVKFLNWHPKQKLVAGLKDTLSYFKDNEIEIPELEDGKKEEGWDSDKKEELAAFLKQGAESKDRIKKKGIRLPEFSLPLSKIYLFSVIALVTYALIWPCLIFGWGVLVFRNNLDAGLKNLEKGEFDKSLGNIRQARAGVLDVQSVLETLEPIRQTGILAKEFELGDDLMKVAVLSVVSAEESVLGVQSLLQSIKAVTGERTESPAADFNSAQLQLTSAGNDLSKVDAIVKYKEGELFGQSSPGKILAQTTRNLAEKLTVYRNLINKAQAISYLLPQLTAVDGAKDYLVLLQNNMELRPGGGFIGSFAKVSFEAGKLKKLAVNDTYAIDGNLKIHVEPPKEIKEDLGQKDWFLRDSNFEPDFPTSARQAEWFYTKETGETVAGVFALDVSAIEELLAVIGPVDLPDYKEKITADNLFEKSVTHAEQSFFPGSQAKKSFLTALTDGVFNKIFFLPQNNWPGIISAISRSLDQGHVSIYLDDSKLFSYVLSQNWAHILPRGSTPTESESKESQDFLSAVEANLGANKANYYLDRSYNLETVIGKDGEISNRLRIGYTNRSPSDAFPGGRYKNRMRVYLPFGSKMTKTLWGETDITKNVSSFVDYGRSGYSMLLELEPKEQKTLVLDYTLPSKLEFQEGKAHYRLDIIKQAGTLKDPFTWTITYPISFKVASNQTNPDLTGTKKIGPQETTITTDLSTNRSFEVEFRK